VAGAGGGGGGGGGCLLQDSPSGKELCKGL
jgi:hypothetical protein